MSDDFIPDAQFKPDSSPAPASTGGAAAPDFVPDGQFQSDDDALQAKYGTGEQQAKAGLEGAARGATLGLSDLAETKLLGVDPAAIKGREQANPATSFLGNVAGGAGLIGLTGGIAAPLEGGALAVGDSALAAKALGYGAEGAVFGAGNSVSDYALGDPNLNAQKIMDNIGMGALFGAGLGAVGSKLGGSVVGDAVNGVADKANAAAETAGALAGTESGGIGAAGSGSVATDAENAATNGGLLTRELKKNAPDILAAGEELGIPVTPEPFLTTDKWEQKAFDSLVSGAPTIRGVARENQLKAGLDVIQDKLGSILDTGDRYGGGAMTKAQLGEAMQKSLTSKIADESAPIQAIYEGLKPHMQAIEVPDSSLNSLSKGILEMPEAKTSFPDASIAKSVAKDVLNFDSVDDIKNYKTNLMQSISPTASPGEKHMVGVLADKLTELEENSIVKAAQNPELPPEAQAQMADLVNQRNIADAQYKPFRQALNSLTEQLGKKNAGGAKTAMGFIQDLDPEKLADKLFDKKYSSFNKFFADKFPEEAALMQQYQKQALREASVGPSGDISLPKFFGRVNKLEPEIQKAIFAPEELRTIKNAETWSNAVPKSFNPSGTAGASAFRSFFESPAGAAASNLRDFGIEAFIRAKQMLPQTMRGNPYQVGAEAAAKFNALSSVQKMADEVNERIADGAKSIFSAKDAARGLVISGAVKGGDMGFDKAEASVKNLAENPAGIIDHMTQHMGNLNQTMPNVTQSLHTTAMAGLSFLNSKLPRSPTPIPGAQPYQPSPAEKAKFVRYYNAVNNPTGVLAQVKTGQLANESLEALQAVHPQLLKQMQQQVAGELKGKDLAKIPYATRMSVAKFLGTPLEPSMTPQAIQANQASLAGPQLGTASAAPTGRRGSMKALNPASRVKTQTQDDESDTN